MLYLYKKDKRYLVLVLRHSINDQGFRVVDILEARTVILPAGKLQHIIDPELHRISFSAFFELLLSQKEVKHQT